MKSFDFVIDLFRWVCIHFFFVFFFLFFFAFVFAVVIVVLLILFAAVYFVCWNSHASPRSPSHLYVMLLLLTPHHTAIAAELIFFDKYIYTHKIQHIHICESLLLLRNTWCARIYAVAKQSSSNSKYIKCTYGKLLDSFELILQDSYNERVNEQASNKEE